MADVIALGGTARSLALKNGQLIEREMDGTELRSVDLDQVTDVKPRWMATTSNVVHVFPGYMDAVYDDIRVHWENRKAA